LWEASPTPIIAVGDRFYNHLTERHEAHRHRPFAYRHFAFYVFVEGAGTLERNLLSGVPNFGSTARMKM
jgi:hypothetical protein